jgi:hypothetical protein
VLALSIEERRLLWQDDRWSESLVAEAQRICSASATDALVGEAERLVELMLQVVPEPRATANLCRWIWRARPQSRWHREAVKLYWRGAELAEASALVGELAENQPSAANRVAFALASLDAGELEQARAMFQTISLADLAPAHRVIARVAVGELKWEQGVAELAEMNPAEAGFSRVRIAQLAGNESMFWDCLRMAAASEEFVETEVLLALAERFCLQRQRWNDLLALYEGRAKLAAAGDGGLLRRAGTFLALRSGRPGLGVRLLERALDAAYRDHRETIEGHLAMLELLTEHCMQSGSHAKAARLLSRALSVYRGDDETMWLSRRGLRVCEQQPGLERAREAFEALREQLSVQKVASSTLPPTAEETVRAAPPIFDEEPEEEVVPEALEDFSESDAELPTRSDMTLAGDGEDSDRREVLRMELVADVEIAAHARIAIDGQSHAAMTRDLSATGVFVVCSAQLPLGAPVTVEISLPGEDDWSLSVHTLQGRITRAEQGIGYGIAFDETSVRFLAELEALCG